MQPLVIILISAVRVVADIRLIALAWFFTLRPAFDMQLPDTMLISAVRVVADIRLIAIMFLFVLRVAFGTLLIVII